ncbi:hypothetical protein NL507_30380, partial [Klebsiella pneumoniae]|nr:hypothetical protein [Klebsiella pneumoniae]
RPVTGPRAEVWPDLMLARYPALLAFDHAAPEVLVIGRGVDAAGAEAQVRRATEWLADGVDASMPAAPASEFEGEAPPEAYEAAVADV